MSLKRPSRIPTATRVVVLNRTPIHSARLESAMKATRLLARTSGTVNCSGRSPLASSLRRRRCSVLSTAPPPTPLPLLRAYHPARLTANPPPSTRITTTRSLTTSTSRHKGIQPTSSDPAPPKPEGHTSNGTAVQLSESEYHELADQYLDRLVYAAEELSENQEEGWDAEFSVRDPLLLRCVLRPCDGSTLRYQDKHHKWIEINPANVVSVFSCRTYRPVSLQSLTQTEEVGSSTNNPPTNRSGSRARSLAPSGTTGSWSELASMRRKAPLSILAMTAPAESGCISETAVALAICYRSKLASSFPLRAIRVVTKGLDEIAKWIGTITAKKSPWSRIPRSSCSSITVYCSYTRLSWADLKKAERHNTCIIQFIPFLRSNLPLATGHWPLSYPPPTMSLSNCHLRLFSLLAPGFGCTPSRSGGCLGLCGCWGCWGLRSRSAEIRRIVDSLVHQSS